MVARTWARGWVCPYFQTYVPFYMTFYLLPSYLILAVYRGRKTTYQIKTSSPKGNDLSPESQQVIELF